MKTVTISQEEYESLMAMKTELASLQAMKTEYQNLKNQVDFLYQSHSQGILSSVKTFSVL